VHRDVYSPRTTSCQALLCISPLARELSRTALDHNNARHGRVILAAILKPSAKPKGVNEGLSAREVAVEADSIGCHISNCVRLIPGILPTNRLSYRYRHCGWRHLETVRGIHGCCRPTIGAREWRRGSSGSGALT